MGATDGPEREDYDDLFIGTTIPTDISKEEAFAVILAAAVCVDRTVSPTEVQEMQALADRTRTMSSLSEETRREYYERAMKTVGDPNRLWDAVGSACAKLLHLHQKDNEPNSPNARDITTSVFAHACDLIFADRNVLDTEKKLLQFLAQRLEIPKEEARAIVQMMQKKNLY